LGNFSGAYGEMQAEYFAGGKGTEQEELVAGNPEYAFNEFLQILIESGIVSFLLFIVIIVVAFRSLIKNHAGMAGSLVSLLVFSCFSYPFSILPFLIVLVFLISAARWNSVARWNADDADNTDRRGFLNNKIRVNLSHPCYPCSIALLCLLLTFFCLYKQYPVYKAYKAWNVQKIYYNANMYKEVAKDCETLYPLLNDQTQFLFEYALSLSKTEQYAKSNEVLKRSVQISCDPMLHNIMGKNYQALKEYDQAEAAFLKSAHLVPNRLYPWYLLTKLYDEMGLPDKVRETAEIVLTKEPKVQSPAVREMREEVGKLGIRN
jgi:tetratricopeptide (TPR) repeat protein